jgi:hypothetical protein
MYHQRFKTIDQRFDEKYAPDENGCLVWRTQEDYPRFFVSRGYVKAHRFAWERANGPPPAGTAVCHRCDNPRCVNVDHLFLGTHADNMRDKAAKGRSHRPIGAKNGRARITPGDVGEIRRLRATGLSQQKIADLYGVSQMAISHLLRGDTWKGVS